ncbi:MAG: 50S ribosomal protein L29 [candidate division KSB1 bacterium]|nr:50S ribosomal protein L29 [candidate division KSB1 bacterium]MDQ7063776.1 50S ribosomal protein L29 [candidate division KSB1 bacterium]
MKMWEINQLSRKELEDHLMDALEEYQNMRFQHAMQQLDNPMRLRDIRKDIARLKTVLREMQMGKRPESPQDF